MIYYIFAVILLLFSTIESQAKPPTTKTLSKSAGSPPTTSDWQLVATDLDALGNDLRIFEIDLNSIKSSSDAVSIRVRITSNSIGRTGYNCGQGELRHQKLDKAIVDLICNKESSARPYGEHERNWKILRTNKTSNGNEMSTSFDLNGINRINDTVTVITKTSSISSSVFQYDCKGYFKGKGDWQTLDVTDHIATVPRGYISPERKAGEEVCKTANHIK